MDSITSKLHCHDYIWYENRSGPVPVTIILRNDGNSYEVYIFNGRDGLVIKTDVECSPIVKWLFADFVHEFHKTKYTETKEWTFTTYSIGYVDGCGDE